MNIFEVLGWDKITDVHAWPLLLTAVFFAGAMFGIFAVSTGPSDFDRCMERADTSAGETACIDIYRPTQ